MNAFEALDYANSIRTRRARLKRALASRKVTLSAVLEADKCHLYSMRVRDLLLAVPSIGDVKAKRIMRQLHIAPETKLENFPMNRREQLVAYIRTEHQRAVV